MAARDSASAFWALFGSGSGTSVPGGEIDDLPANFGPVNLRSSVKTGCRQTELLRSRRAAVTCQWSVASKLWPRYCCTRCPAALQTWCKHRAKPHCPLLLTRKLTTGFGKTQSWPMLPYTFLLSSRVAPDFRHRERPTCDGRVHRASCALGHSAREDETCCGPSGKKAAPPGRLPPASGLPGQRGQCRCRCLPSCPMSAA